MKLACPICLRPLGRSVCICRRCAEAFRKYDKHTWGEVIAWTAKRTRYFVAREKRAAVKGKMDVKITTAVLPPEGA